MTTRIAAKLVSEKAAIPDTVMVYAGDGEKLGYVEPRTREYSGGIAWHAVFSIGVCANGVALAQGHGDNPEMAIVDAINSTRAGIALSTERLDALEKKIYGIPADVDASE